MEPHAGAAPASVAWKATILAGIRMRRVVPKGRIERPSAGYKAAALPLS